QCARDLQPALVPVGEAAGLVSGEVGEAQALQQQSGLVRDGALRAVEERTAEQRIPEPMRLPATDRAHVVEHAQLAPQTDVLEGARDAQPGALAGARAGEVAAA